MEEIYKELQNSWIIQQNRKPNELYKFFKSLPIGVNLTVTVDKILTEYQIKANAEGRTSTGYETVVATTATLEEALKIAVEECLEWLNDFK